MKILQDLVKILKFDIDEDYSDIDPWDTEFWYGY